MFRTSASLGIDSGLFCLPQVYVEQLEMADLLLIAGAMNPNVDPAILRAMVTFNATLHHATMVDRKYVPAPGPLQKSIPYDSI